MIVISRWITELGLWSVLVFIEKCSEVFRPPQIKDEKNSGRLKSSPGSCGQDLEAFRYKCLLEQCSGGLQTSIY